MCVPQPPTRSSNARSTSKIDSATASLYSTSSRDSLYSYFNPREAATLIQHIERSADVTHYKAAAIGVFCNHLPLDVHRSSRTEWMTQDERLATVAHWEATLNAVDAESAKLHYTVPSRADKHRASIALLEAAVSWAVGYCTCSSKNTNRVCVKCFTAAAVSENIPASLMDSISVRSLFLINDPSLHIPSTLGLQIIRLLSAIGGTCVSNDDLSISLCRGPKPILITPKIELFGNTAGTGTGTDNPRV
eukprot:Lankesteria_metandrocarpae@DN6660_c0_g1_i1.p1